MYCRSHHEQRSRNKCCQQDVKIKNGIGFQHQVLKGGRRRYRPSLTFKTLNLHETCMHFEYRGCLFIRMWKHMSRISTEMINWSIGCLTFYVNRTKKSMNYIVTLDLTETALVSKFYFNTVLLPFRLTFFTMKKLKLCLLKNKWRKLIYW